MSRPFRGGPNMGEVGGSPVQQARLALMNNQPERAQELCRRRLEKRPDDYATRLVLAQALIQLRQPREAIIEVRRVLAVQPNNADALILLSSALLNVNQFNVPKEALTAAQRAVQLQPKVARGYVQLAQVQLVQRQYKDAEEAASEALQIDPRLGAASLVKGMALLQMKNHEGAVTNLRAALRQDRTQSSAYIALAQALIQLKRGDEALEAIDSAQKEHAPVPEGQLVQLRAQAYRKQNKYGKAFSVILEFTQRTSRFKAIAPIIAGYTFFFSLFGQGAIAVLIFVLLAILFGISKIPFAGGGLVDVILIALAGFLTWQVTRQFTGASPIVRLAQGRTALFTAIAFVVPIVLVFGIAAFIGRGQHHDYWFTTITFGLAGVLAFLSAGVTLNLAGGQG
jgi:cytochrome c-type biogenesis protein CcmH/NrfG